jgi:integrase
MTPSPSSTPESASASSTPSTVTKITTKRPDELENRLSKYKHKDLTIVADYLSTKARKSKQTAFAYSFALEHFNKFIEQNYKGYNIQTILEPLTEQGKQQKQIDLYKLLNDFISYLQNDTINGHDLSAKSIKLYIAAVKSYLAYNDIEISSNKFKNKITMPPVYHEDEEAIDANDIKEILHHCNNRRLKTYLLVLASGGMRAIEALAIRERDLDFSDINFSDLSDKANPAGVRIRKEYSKTKTERHIFISNEAARYVKDWLNWKYRDRRHYENKYLKKLVRSEDNLVFSKTGASTKNPHGLYGKMLIEFQKVLDLAGLKSRKEDGVFKRRKVTFHSLRRFVKTTIANQTRNSDYSEWFLGHRKSTYWVNKKPELKRIYKEDCMKYLTFLDYPTVEAVGTSFAAKLKEKEKEIDELKRRDMANAEHIARLEAKIDDQYKQYEMKFLQSRTYLEQRIPALVERIFKNTHTIKEISDKTQEMTNEQKIRSLSLILEAFANASTEAESLLTKGTSTDSVGSESNS